MIETQHKEFKENWREENLKSITAFANTRGGVLFIGVDDSGVVKGLKGIKNVLETIPNIINNKLSIIPSVIEKEEQDKGYIEIVVGESSVPISYNGRYYIRSGSTNQELQGTTLSEFLLKKSGRTWDEIEIKEANFDDDIDTVTIKRFKSFARERIPDIEYENDERVILQKMNLDSVNLKRASVILFGKNPQQFFGSAIVKIAYFISASDIDMQNEVRGNLFEQAETTIDILRNKYLKSKIEYEGIERKDILDYPLPAIREALLNALVHRNYSTTSAIQIRVFDDKLEFINEGSLPPEISLASLKGSHISKPRNILIAEVFQKAGFIETWGRGTNKIIQSCKDAGLPEPDFKAENGVFTLTFYKDKWNQENLKQTGLHPRQIKAVLYVQREGRITSAIYQKMNSVKNRQATIDLNDLVERDILENIGKGRGSYYKLKPDR
jgi:ATP-dependent DNA helicase RecG